MVVCDGEFALLSRFLMSQIAARTKGSGRGGPAQAPDIAALLDSVPSPSGACDAAACTFPFATH